MKSVRFWRDTRGVSSTIATILLLAIVVILGAVIGTYALNFSQESIQQERPQAVFAHDFANEAVDGDPSSDSGDQSPGPGDSDTVDKLTITYQTGTNLKVGPSDSYSGGSPAEIYVMIDRKFEDDAGYNNFESQCTDMDNGWYKCPFDYLSPTNEEGDNNLVAGDRFVIYSSNASIDLNGATVKIIYNNPNNGVTYILQKWTVSGPTT